MSAHCKHVKQPCCPRRRRLGGSEWNLTDVLRGIRPMSRCMHSTMYGADEEQNVSKIKCNI